jgi:ribonucleoside-diphosphate reductase alpha chain
LAQAEPTQRSGWEQRFCEALQDFRFLPGGRILAGAGMNRRVTLFNCFVMGEIEDSLEGIFTALKEGAMTMQQGGGVGYDFSTLRPSGSIASQAGQLASGPVSFLQVWNAMCATLVSTSMRRGAMMATLRCDHPDIEAFIEAKRDPAALPYFNLSVLVTDAFLNAVERGSEWLLRFDSPDGGLSITRSIDARRLWQRIAAAAHETGEPGAIFIDRVRREDNLGYCETINATNPCGEVPLPSYGCCDLGSINLTRFVRSPFTGSARLDLNGIVTLVPVAVRMLDNVYDVSRYPLPQQREQALAARRIGLGITGLADALMMLGLRYGSEAARHAAGGVMRTITHAAYHASVELAREKGAFPLFDVERYLAGDFAARLPPDLRAAIAAHGLRNSHLTAIAPAGSISLLAGNVSSGIEPVFDSDFRRAIRIARDNVQSVLATDYACALYRRVTGARERPSGFVAAADVAPEEQLAMQADLQQHVDGAVSKTVYVARPLESTAVASLYERAHKLGLKGCTMYGASAARGAVLQPIADRCCVEPVVP